VSEAILSVADTDAGGDIAVSAPTPGVGTRSPEHPEFARRRERLAARAIDAVIMVGTYWLLEALDVAPPAHYSSVVTGDSLDTGIASLLRASVVIPLGG